MVNISGFLLSYLKYGDNHAVLHCFTSENGYQSFFAKGIYSAKSKKKPYLFPLNLLNITVSNSKVKTNVKSISNIELISGFSEMMGVKSSSPLFFVAEFLNNVLREEQKNPELFDAILKLQNEIFQNNITSYASFLFHFLIISGVSPLLKKGAYLNPETGIFGDEISHHLFDEQTSAIWKKFLTEDIYQIQLKRTDRNLFVDSLMVYFTYHFSEFRVPKSLEILRQVYE